MKYSDLMADWLAQMGYTHCFTVGGGNIMHLTESLSRKMTMVAVVNEVAAGIAVEYFNESNPSKKALALVTAGPGLTNIVTAMAGAFLESRELLVIGGQAKTADLARGQVRQRGIQEIDGVSIAKPVTIQSVLMEAPLDGHAFSKLVLSSRQGRKGPVFIEIPLDVQAQQVSDFAHEIDVVSSFPLPRVPQQTIDVLVAAFNHAARPVLLLGGGISRVVATQLEDRLTALCCPIMTTWNGADRFAANHANYLGRPNTWGQRSANIVLQQSDLVIALGTRLGLQQTGFNWQQFVPHGLVAQVEIDQSELNKGHPRVDIPILGDANQCLEDLLATGLASKKDWLLFAKEVRDGISLSESVNQPRPQFISPFDFVENLSEHCNANDVIIPCSSGSAFTSMMQVFCQKQGQVIVTNKGLASMGYGLSGAIGACFANPDKRIVLVEGDGGFAQNLQELGTVGINHLNLKIFIYDDSGYASIRMTQKNYFGGRYVGCDQNTGLGLPHWDRLFSAWDISVMRLVPGFETNPAFQLAFDAQGPHAFIVSVDPEQTYFPKISSRVTETGAMESNPLHLMTPPLSEDQATQFLKYLR
jgi:acetolactate synthase-1/2/3 large subunit